MKTKYKIAKAGGLLDEVYEELEDKGIDTESDLMIHLKDAILASDLACQHIETCEREAEESP